MRVLRVVSTTTALTSAVLFVEPCMAGDETLETGRAVEVERTVEADDGTAVVVDDLMLMPDSGESLLRFFAWDMRATMAGGSLRIGRSGSGPLALRVDDSGRRSGALALEAAGWTVRTGTLRFDHGFGLLALGAGRWRRVSASQSLARPRGAVGVYTGVDPDRRLTGMALSRRGGELSGDIVVSGREDLTFPGEEHIWAARLRSNAAGVSVSAVGSPGALAASCLFDGVWERGSWAVEAAGASGDGAVRGAGAARIDWKGSRRGGEVLLIAGDDLATPLSDGLPLVSGTSGGAWAVRGWTTTGSGVRWNVLVHQGAAQRERSGVLGVERRLRIETSVRWRTEHRVRFDARLRRDGEQRRGWADTRPWEPPGIDWNRSDWSLAFRVAGDWRGWDLSASLADRHREDDGVRRSRHLVHLQGERSLGGAGTLRLGHTWSRGGPLDLMTADAPAPGLLAVRHARWLDRLWTVGWAAELYGYRASLAIELLERSEAGGERLDSGIRVRVRGGR